MTDKLEKNAVFSAFYDVAIFSAFSKKTIQQLFAGGGYGVSFYECAHGCYSNVLSYRGMTFLFMHHGKLAMVRIVCRWLSQRVFVIG
jgi:hypothetical protein